MRRKIIFQHFLLKFFGIISELISKDKEDELDTEFLERVSN